MSEEEAETESYDIMAHSQPRTIEGFAALGLKAPYVAEPFESQEAEEHTDTKDGGEDDDEEVPFQDVRAWRENARVDSEEPEAEDPCRETLHENSKSNANGKPEGKGKARAKEQIRAPAKGRCVASRRTISVQHSCALMPLDSVKSNSTARPWSTISS